MKSIQQFLVVRRAGLWTLALAALIGAPSHSQSVERFSNSEHDIARVAELLDRRLSLMHEVAAWKWRAQQPVVDFPRERAVLDASVADAQSIGLDGTAARRFFDVQIRMARDVQEQAFARWRAAEAAPLAGRDLAAELRPLLDAIGRDLLVAVYLAANDFDRPESASMVSAALTRLDKYGVNAQLLSELHESMRAIRIVKHANASVVDRVRVLRVGTTGDYAPFSYERNGELRGFDVELARALAESWGVNIEFVRTTWPTLMSDFLAHRFDVAISGISVTAERAAQADFSAAYHTDGKTPIARCDDAPRFATLERIDRPEVRVVVNPGGTNERFVRDRIKRAVIRVHPDNRTVFDEIVDGRADVMITDGIEVQLQTLRHPTLCGTTAAPFTQAQKAIMLPLRSDFTTRVNTWLRPQLVSGKLADRLRDALEQAR